MKILVVGGGAREHTLLWKLAQSTKVNKLFAALGNAGTAQLAENLPISATDIPGLVKAAQEKKIDLVVVGPDAPLAIGLVDALTAERIPVFGPTAKAALIESSKIFSAKLMDKYDIPHASGNNFSSHDAPWRHILALHNHINKKGIVIKADGLASGKGVVVAKNLEEALDGLDKFLLGPGKTGGRVRIEEMLVGKEFSFMVFTDGRIIVPLPIACDYKRVYDGDIGPNTGGMGAYSPCEFIDSQLAKRAQDIMQKAVDAMYVESRRFMGLLYGGFITTNEGLIKVLEFNARFGDPETQVQIPRLKTDLVDILMAVINRTLDKIKIEWTNDACVGVVMSSEGYPGEPKTGREITGLKDIDKDIMIFHAGTEIKDKILVTAGGRVLTVVAKGKTIAEAREKVYDNISRIHFDGCHYRRDIALNK